jgi:FKBP-type peptidyl-prolyl cis-trans isomerase FkpA
MTRPGRSALLSLAVFVSVLGSAACDGSEDSPTSPSPVVTFAVTDIVVGTGAEAVNGNVLVVDYAGWLYDANAPENKGRLFDTSLGREPFAFVLGAGQVIRGWDLGLPGMRVGGFRRLVVPPELAYGSQGAGGGTIPPNAALVFEVNLLAVQ